ncbi:MAG: hypothetical protein LBK97_03230 [Prevotellaceae bacterium]|jgi:hypothetical protein|nr:hypothetical protein [Prevotellaceae bacterium]
MEKKINNFNFTVTILLIMTFAPCFLSGQNYMPKERAKEIKTSGMYYWDECSDSTVYGAKDCAFDGLRSIIIRDAVNQSINQDKVLEAIEMYAHFDRLQQMGRIKILAWIAKDRVYTKDTLSPDSTVQQPPVKEEKEEKQHTQSPIPQTDTVFVQGAGRTPVKPDSPVLKKLLACKTYKDVRRVATANGLIRGKINSSEGFGNPEKCIIAVFLSADSTLSALLDVGSGSRKDLMSGETIQNIEQHYSCETYFLWYLQQKNN